MKLTHIKHPDGTTFLTRLSCHFSKGSIKLHIIKNDDIAFHTHPWDFTSIILFGGYNERIIIGPEHNPNKKLHPILNPYFTHYHDKTYGWLDKNKKHAEAKHLVTLRKGLFGIRWWTVTIGWYGQKKQLCSLCQELGYCKTEREREKKNWVNHGKNIKKNNRHA